MTSRVIWQWGQRQTINWHSRWNRSRWNQIRSHQQAHRVQRKYFERFSRRAFLFSATGLYKVSAEPASNNHDWEDCSIRDDHFYELSDEMIELERLKLATLMCKACKKHLIIGKPLPDKEYCSCPENHAVEDPETGWQPYIENQDIIIWRREQVPGEGLYAFKVYGRYNEITAEDFIAMHMDMDYWKTWDNSVVSITPLETKEEEKGGETVFHWESLWPRFFANRDYVYVKRYAHLKNNKKTATKKLSYPSYDYNSVYRDSDVDDSLFVIVSRSCEHPKAPETNKAFRVKTYWSNMVIKPIENKSKPGIEYCLTYFDDPGVSMPAALQSWVAGHACPDFLVRMRAAAQAYNRGFNESENREESQIEDEKEAINENRKEIQPEAEIIKVVEDVPKNQIEVQLTESSKVEEELKENALLATKSEKSNEITYEKIQEQSEKQNIINQQKSSSDEPSKSAETPSQGHANSYWNLWNYWPLYYFS